MQVGHLEVGVAEAGVRHAVTEFVDWGDVGAIESTVVDEDAFFKLDLRHRLVNGVKHISTIVGTGVAKSERKLCAGVDTTVQDISNGVAGLLTRHTSPEDSGDIRVVLVRADLESTGRMDHENSVVAVSGNVGNDGLDTLPESQVLAVTKVLVFLDVAFTRVSVGKD